MKDWMDREAKKYQDKNARKGLMLQYQWGVLVLKARLKENLMNATSHSTGGTAEETLDVTEFQKPAMDLLNAYLSACSDPDFVDPSSSKTTMEQPEEPAPVLRNNPSLIRKWGRPWASAACLPRLSRIP